MKIKIQINGESIDIDKIHNYNDEMKNCEHEIELNINPSQLKKLENFLDLVIDDKGNFYNYSILKEKK